MDRMEQLQKINLAFQGLLATPDPADLAPSHKADDLMVWFLLGGKDVGKSTFLNALLRLEISREPPESAEGTKEFVAYLHESARSELAERLQGLPIQVRFHTHRSELHQRLCLIDSPDFDSRFERHASQVGEVLQAGAADGAVLLASPEKYKNHTYWKVFSDLSRALSPQHILFALTKADELGTYLDEVRADFVRTIGQRMVHWRKEEGDGSGPLEGRIFLLNSLNQDIDFPTLENRLLRKLSSADVRKAQDENIRHSLLNGVDRLREHYRLEEIRDCLKEAGDPKRLDEIHQECFPDAFYHSVASRFTRNTEIAAALREQAWARPGYTLAGMTALKTVIRNPFRRTSQTALPEGGQILDIRRLTRWGEEELEERIKEAQEKILSGIKLEYPQALERHQREQPEVRESLGQRLDDLLAVPVFKGLGLPLRLLLNLPIYLYFLFFLALLLNPVLLLLRAWNVPHAVDLGNLFTVENVAVSLIGFAGYYLMAALFILRRQKERIGREIESLSEHFTAELALFLRGVLPRPLARFEADFKQLTRLSAS